MNNTQLAISMMCHPKYENNSNSLIMHILIPQIFQNKTSLKNYLYELQNIETIVLLISFKVLLILLKLY